MSDSALISERETTVSITASARITVVTESGARYFIRTHGARAYVTRQGDVDMTGTRPVNRVTTTPIHLFKGEPMTILFDDGLHLRTTPVVAVQSRFDVYPR